MPVLSAIFMGLREIWAHKVRSTLTLFCVLLGVAAVVVTVAYMRGMTASWRVYLNERGGLERLRVHDEPVPEEMEHLEELSPGRTINDAIAIARHCDHIANVSPIIELTNGFVYYGSERNRTDIEGVLPTARFVERYDLTRGRFITDLDNERCSQVAVLGSEPAEDLFGPLEDPIGKTIMIRHLPFEVVGLLEHYHTGMGRRNWISWKNDVVFIPIRTAQHKITNSDQLSELDIQVEDVAYLEPAVQQIENVLLRMHRGVLDFEVTTSESHSEDIEKRERSLLTAGAAISLITIIIGGIGIMNLMLASINERVREIGIRKAVGARSSDIFFQFCVEAVTICLLGGFIGVVLGQAVIYYLQQVITETDPPVFTIFGVVAGFAASVTIGILAGLYPALRAARLDPIDALRYE